MNRFAEMLNLYCRLNKISVRQLAKATGMANTTAARVLNGEEPSTKNFMALLNWLMEPAQSQEGENE